MTVDIATQFLHCENSKKLWEEAQSLVGAHPRSRITYLKSEFHSTKKGEMKMHDYLFKMKNLADKLKLEGNLILNSDLIIQTLNGLDFEYNPVVVKLSDQINLSWIDLQSQLLSFESRIEQLNSFNNLSLNASTNVTNKTDYKETRETIDLASMAQMETGEAQTREVGEEAGSLNLPVKYAQRLVTQQCSASIGLTKPTQDQITQQKRKRNLHS